MSEPSQKLSQPAAPAAEGRFLMFHWLMSGLCLAGFAVALLMVWLPGDRGWPDAALVLLAAAATLVSLSRQLPVQNVTLAAVGIAFIGGVVHCVGATTSIPFGPFIYGESAGPRIFETLPWPVPLIWVIAILNSRGVARLILRPWRKLRAYGFWVIGLTAVLTMLFDLNLEPFATRLKHYWFWSPTRFPLTWYDAPLVNSLGWLLAALLILAFVTPALINKRQRPVKRPPDYHPLAVWLLANALFAAGAAAHGLWLATGVGLVVSAVVTVFAHRGAKW